MCQTRLPHLPPTVLSNSEPTPLKLRPTLPPPPMPTNNDNSITHDTPHPQVPHTIRIRAMTYNALSLLDPTPNRNTCSFTGRQAVLEHQLNAACIDIAGLQETRVKAGHASSTSTKNYHIATAGPTPKGAGGIQIWASAFVTCTSFTPAHAYSLQRPPPRMPRHYSPLPRMHHTRTTPPKTWTNGGNASPLLPKNSPNTSYATPSYSSTPTLNSATPTAKRVKQHDDYTTTRRASISHPPSRAASNIPPPH